MANTRVIEIAADMGESFGNYVIPNGEEMMKLIDTAYIACGWHAGDPKVMRQNVQWCKQYGVVFGGHPGFPDMAGFGRRRMLITPEETRDYIIYQLGALQAFGDLFGLKLRTAKPHGAFCVWAMLNEENAGATLEGLKSIRSLEAVHMPAWAPNPFHDMVEASGLRLVKEFYPGLEYSEDQTFAITRKYKATPQHESELVRRWLKTGTTETVDGTEIPMEAECICIHGDLDLALETTAAVRRVLKEEGIEVRSVLS